jgi:hypothetical protein
MIPDKRDECGCHRGCTVLDHECLFPCRWPACLTWQEHAQLAAEILADEIADEVIVGDLTGWRPTGILPYLDTTDPGVVMDAPQPMPRPDDDTARRMYDLAYVARSGERSSSAARELASLAEQYGGPGTWILGHSVTWWRELADLIDQGVSGEPGERPTTTGETMPDTPREVTYPGTAPADIRVEYRLNGAIRFRIRDLAGREMVADLTDTQVDDLAHDLTNRYPR